MDLYFNRSASFTDWVVETGALREPFVVLDVGVQGGENPRWHRLRDHLVVHGLDAIKEVIDVLREQNSGYPNRHYHWLAAGSVEEEREFYFNAADPCSSSLYLQGATRFATERRDEVRTVQVRPLDKLLKDNVISCPDFLKVDVEGFEKEVLAGAMETLRSVLGLEIETNFAASPTYPSTHFCTLQEMVLPRHLLLFDLNFNRLPRASFQQAIVKKGFQPITDHWSVGRPATFNVLFCRDVIDERDHPENYPTPSQTVSIDQIIKFAIICELHGLNDVALDAVAHFQKMLSPRLDVDRAIYLLADPSCRSAKGMDGMELREANAALERRLSEMESSRSWRVTAPLRRLGNILRRPLSGGFSADARPGPRHPAES